MPCFSTVEAVCRGVFYLTVGRGPKSLSTDILAARRSQQMILFFLQIQSSLTTVGIELKDLRY